MDRLGKDYICSHLVMYYSDVLCEWFLELSENDYYNDTTRNPEKVIRVIFGGIDCGTGREVYKGIDDGRYYLRENFYPRETFAKWYICGCTRKIDDGYEPRANLIFECNGQKEKVRYDDWNGVAAYGDTFNKDFSDAARNIRQGRKCKYRINTIPGKAAKEKGYASYPEDFPHLPTEKDFIAWKDGDVWEVETTLTGEALKEQLRTLK